jgi:hypothetical protein
MKDLYSNNKVIGIVGVIFGSIGFASLFAGDINDLLIPFSNNIFIKYAVIIGISYGSMYFIIMGILIYIGKIMPSHRGISKYERAKNHLFTNLFLAPFIPLGIFMIIVLKEKYFWKFLGLLMIIYWCWSVHSSIRILKEKKLIDKF